MEDSYRQSLGRLNTYEMNSQFQSHQTLTSLAKKKESGLMGDEGIDGRAQSQNLTFCKLCLGSLHRYLSISANAPLLRTPFQPSSEIATILFHTFAYMIATPLPM